ncbi:hypothetical protein HanIR_Chr08g0379081 [Helianthus annuus]|nr:hypothetical protein HanIR_Chr08g0379081 [Helianthus annuus]
MIICPDDHSSRWPSDRTTIRSLFSSTHCFTHCSMLTLSYCDQANSPALPSIQDCV